MRMSIEQQHGHSGLQRLFTGVAATLVALMAIPSTSLAQSNAEDGASMLEEVIVTATRREESLMEVPIAVTAFSAADLQDFGVLDITYISQMSPNTTLKVSRGTNTTLTAFIRGVGQQDPVAGFESGVKPWQKEKTEGAS